RHFVDSTAHEFVGEGSVGGSLNLDLYQTMCGRFVADHVPKVLLEVCEDRMREPREDALLRELTRRLLAPVDPWEHLVVPDSRVRQGLRRVEHPYGDGTTRLTMAKSEMEGRVR